MPDIYGYDSDGCPLWSEPKKEAGWDLGSDPAAMNGKTVIAAVASEILNCPIKWWHYYCDWCCGCKNGRHACDSQCSALADASTMLRIVRPVLEEYGISPSITFNMTNVECLRVALTAWRNVQERLLSNATLVPQPEPERVSPILAFIRNLASL